MTNLLLPYNIWRTTKENKESALDCVLRELAENERVINGQDQQTSSMVIADSRSVKNTDTAEQKGFDAGKNVRH
jgi:hypothetical protein